LSILFLNSTPSGKVIVEPFDFIDNLK
jgi:hypothetical protein